MAKTVMAFGSFDIIHLGHILYLKKAKELGGRLIVVVARDRSIEMFKGRKPFFRESDRVKMVGSLKGVDMAVLGNKISTPEARMEIIRRYRPDVIAFGYDQKIDEGKIRRWLGENGIKAKVVRIRLHLNEKRYKSSAIRSVIGDL